MGAATMAGQMGAAGAAGAMNALNQGAKGMAGESHFFDETVTPEKIKHLLDNVDQATGKTFVSDKIEGMKYLLASMAHGRDVSEYYADVVKNAITKSVECKKLVYTYLVNYADLNPTCKELALLGINSFQRDLSDPNQLIRAMALRVLCSIRERAIVQIQLMSLKKCASDSSAYVKKTAAQSVGKVASLDPESKDEIVEIIERLLNDRNTQVLSSAIAAFNEVCPENLAMLHPHYRKFCQLLADLDEWGQITTLTVFTRYCRTFFTNPALLASGEVKPKAEEKTKKKKKKDFYDDDDSDEEDSDEEDDEDEDEEDEDDELGVDGLPKIPADHQLVLNMSANLLRSRNSGVVLAVASLHHYVGVGSIDKSNSVKIGRSLVRIMRNRREIQYVVLTNAAFFARENPDIFRKYLKDFFVAESEPTFVRKMKVDVLAALVNEENFTFILREFTRYVKDDDKDFVRYTIQCIVRIANSMPSIAARCLHGLMGLVSTDNNEIVAEAVIAIRQLVQQHPQHDGPIIRLAKKLEKIASPSARAAIVWILGEFQSKPRVMSMAPDALRVLAKNFKEEHGEVKAQIVNLAAKTSLWQPDSKPVALLLKYILELSRYDVDFDLRDRSRLLRHLLLGGNEIPGLIEGTAEDAGAVIGVRQAAGSADAETMAAELAVPEPVAGDGETSGSGESSGGEPVEGASSADVPVAVASSAPVPPTSSSNASPAKAAAPVVPAVSIKDRMRAVLLAAKPPPEIAAAMESTGSKDFSLGSLSLLVGHAARGYHALPDWSAEGSLAKLRDPPVDEDEEEEKNWKKKAAKRDEEEEEEEDSDEEDEDEDDEDDEDEDEEEEEDEEDSDEEEEEEDEDDD